MATKDIDVLEGQDRTETLMEWARANANKLAIGGMVVVAVAAIGMFMRAAKEKKEVNASQALASAQMVVQSGNAALAQSDLQALIKRYGGTSAAVQARMLLAQVHFTQGKAAEGLKELDAVGNPGPFASAFHALRAAGLELSGKPADAAAAYQQAAATAPTRTGKAAFESDAARAYVAAGNVDAARKIWEAMAADDGNPLAAEAKVRLGEILAKPIGG